MKRVYWLWAMAIVVVLGIVGCLSIPLGDPEQSKVDDSLVGLWMNQANGEQGELLAVMQYDPRTFLISQMKFSKTDSGVTPHGQTNSKAWLTKIGETQFITAEIEDPKLLLETSGKTYLVAKITRSDDKVTIQQVSEDFVKEAGVSNTAELTKLISENLANPHLFENETTTYVKVSGDQTTTAKAVIDAFTPQ